jgi:RNA recognition motif-containing protein
MSSTVFLGNLPPWVTADDIKQWLAADNLVADSVKVIRNPETQESKGFAFIEAPNEEEMNTIIRRLDRAPLEDRLLRANPAQPPRSRGPVPSSSAGRPPMPSTNGGSAPAPMAAADRDRNRRGGKKHRRAVGGPQSAFAEELAKAL